MKKSKVERCSGTFETFTENKMHVSITSFGNGEGFTVDIECGIDHKLFDIHHDELDAINALVLFSRIRETDE